VEVANANMANAVRLISLQRGYDPREFALVAFGGAGPLHGAAIAADLGIPTVLVPPRPGAWSALGCLMVEIRHDLSEMFLAAADDADPDDVEAAFARMEDHGRALLEAEGVAAEEIRLERSIAMRYLGQWRSMEVAVTNGSGLEEAVEQFHRAHEREYSYRRDDAPVELYRLQLMATGRAAELRLPESEPDEHARMPGPAETRPVWFDGHDAPQDTPVYARDDLRAGAAFSGPAVIEQLDATTLVPPGVSATVEGTGTIRMTISQED
jgi:N-methylhydantoinase A